MNQLQLLESITQYLVQANTAIPLVFGIVTSVAGLFKAVTGEGPSLQEVAAMIEAQHDTNVVDIKNEIDRLKTLLGMQ